LTQVSQDAVAWVHAVKVQVGARIIDGRQRHDAGA
jgi:hypothetical protein